MRINGDSLHRHAPDVPRGAPAPSRALKRSFRTPFLAVGAVAALVVGLPGMATAEDPPAGGAAEVTDLGPGRLDPGLGGFVLSQSDVPEVSLSRQYVADAQLLADRPDLAVFGIGWRAEWLGGTTSFALVEAPGEVRVVAPDGAERRYQQVGAGTYRAADGAELTRSGGEIVERTVYSGLVFQWAPVAGQWRVTAVGTSETGMDRVAYDAQGRVTRVTIGTPEGSGTEHADIHYAGGLVESVSYVAGSGSAPVTVAEYRYDLAGRLVSVATPRDGLQTTYTYDALSRLTTVDSPTTGAWTFQYGAGSDPVSAEEDPGTIAASVCTTATSYMWSESGCWADPVRHYGSHSPSWKTTPTGKSVVGIYEDHCSLSADEPHGFDFRPACDMHDYGYGVIASGYLSSDKKNAVDEVLYTTLKDHTCPAYWDQWGCRMDAFTYRQGVRFGDPMNGA
jgi:YD repeat-containing protein